MAITATIMAITKTTTPTNRLAYSLGAFALLLAVLAAANLFASFPLPAQNKKLDSELQAAVKLPFSKRIVELDRLRDQQEKLLAQGPSDPFAWGRLSYLRKTTQGDAKGALLALHMSDLVSPYDPLQTPGRALQWHNLRASESDEEKAYQTELWQKAVLMNGKVTWGLAVDNHVVKEVEQALQSGDPALLKAWKDQEGFTGHFE